VLSFTTENNHAYEIGLLERSGALKKISELFDDSDIKAILVGGSRSYDPRLVSDSSDIDITFIVSADAYSKEFGSSDISYLKYDIDGKELDCIINHPDILRMSKLGWHDGDIENGSDLFQQMFAFASTMGDIRDNLIYSTPEIMGALSDPGFKAGVSEAIFQIIMKSLEEKNVKMESDKPIYKLFLAYLNSEGMKLDDGLAAELRDFKESRKFGPLMARMWGDMENKYLFLRSKELGTLDNLNSLFGFKDGSR
jgi:hypothetical protein